MATHYLGEIRPLTYAQVPNGWALCDGSILSIASYSGLFSLIGTAFGGDGQTTFGLPDLRGRIPVGTGPGFTPGQTSGQETIALDVSQMPSHTHQVRASGDNAASLNPTGKVPAVSDMPAYVGQRPDTSLAPSSVGPIGGGAHENRQPYAVVNYIIALTGIVPPRPLEGEV